MGHVSKTPLQRTLGDISLKVTSVGSPVILTETGRREEFVRKNRKQFSRIRTKIALMSSLIGLRPAPRIRGRALTRQWMAMEGRTVVFPDLTNTAVVHPLVHTLHHCPMAVNARLPGCGMGSNGAPHQIALASDRRTIKRVRTRHRANYTFVCFLLLLYSPYRLPGPEPKDGS